MLKLRKRARRKKCRISLSLCHQRLCRPYFTHLSHPLPRSFFNPPRDKFLPMSAKRATTSSPKKKENSPKNRKKITNYCSFPNLFLTNWDFFFHRTEVSFSLSHRTYHNDLFSFFVTHPLSRIITSIKFGLFYFYFYLAFPSPPHFLLSLLLDWGIVRVSCLRFFLVTRVS